MQRKSRIEPATKRAGEIERPVADGRQDQSLGFYAFFNFSEPVCAIAPADKFNRVVSGRDAGGRSPLRPFPPERWTGLG